MNDYYLEKINTYENLLKFNYNDQYEYKKNKYLYKLNNQYAGADLVEDLFIDNEFKKYDLPSVLETSDVIILNITENFFRIMKYYDNENILNINSNFDKIKEKLQKKLNEKKMKIDINNQDNIKFDIFIDIGFKISFNELFDNELLKENNESNNDINGGSKLGFSMRNIKLFLFLIKNYDRYKLILETNFTGELNDNFKNKNKNDYTTIEKLIMNIYNNYKNNNKNYNFLAYNNNNNNESNLIKLTYIIIILNLINYNIYEKKIKENKSIKENKIYNNLEIIKKYSDIHNILKDLKKNDKESSFINMFKNIFKYTNDKKSIDIKLILIRRQITLKDFKLDGIISKKLLSIKNNNNIINSNDKIIDIIKNTESNNSRYIKINNSYYKQMSFDLDYHLKRSDTEIESDNKFISEFNKTMLEFFIGGLCIFFCGGFILVAFSLIVGLFSNITFGVIKVMDKLDNNKPIFTQIKNTDNIYLNEMNQLLNYLKNKKK